MESPHEIFRSSSKRKQIEDKDLRACKTPRISLEHGPSCAHSCQCCHMQANLADKCLSFLNSGVPCRIMFYNHGEWLDFPDQVKQNLVVSFKNEKSCSKMTMCGQPILIDLLSMTMVNLRTKKQHSVAWIDEAAKCFFPSCISDGKADEFNELAGSVIDSIPRKPVTEQSFVDPPEVVKQVIVEKGTTISRKHASMEIVKMRIENVPRDSRDFLFVQNTFLSGMRPFAMAESILHIHRYVPKDVSAQIALGAFERQIKATRAECGDADVRYGWFGLKKLQLACILIHGFGTVLKPTEGLEVGNCIYLTPHDRAFASVNLCDVDEKEVQYMMLCRIILGKMKEALPGSDQFVPNSKAHDSGGESPRCYRVWLSQAHTHVHPEYIVAFKLCQNVREYLFGLNDVLSNSNPRSNVQKFSNLHHTNPESVKGPNSPWISLTVLFAEIEGKISPTAKELLYHHYGELKRKAITREDLVKKMRVIIGDKLLLFAFMKLKRDTSSWYGDSSPKSRPDNLVDSAEHVTDARGCSKMVPNVVSATEIVNVDIAASRSENNVRAIKIEPGLLQSSDGDEN